VKVSLDAFSPSIPHNAEESGLPVALLRCIVKNTGGSIANVSLAFSIDNPVKVLDDHSAAAALHRDSRQTEFRMANGLQVYS